MDHTMRIPAAGGPSWRLLLEEVELFFQFTAHLAMTFINFFFMTVLLPESLHPWWHHNILLLACLCTSGLILQLACASIQLLRAQHNLAFAIPPPPLPDRLRRQRAPSKADLPQTPPLRRTHVAPPLRRTHVAPPPLLAAPIVHSSQAAPIAHSAQAAPIAHSAQAAPIAHSAQAAPIAHSAQAAPVAHSARAAIMPSTAIQSQAHTCSHHQPSGGDASYDQDGINQSYDQDRRGDGGAARYVAREQVDSQAGGVVVVVGVERGGLRGVAEGAGLSVAEELNIWNRRSENGTDVGGGAGGVPIAAQSTPQSLRVKGEARCFDPGEGMGGVRPREVTGHPASDAHGGPGSLDYLARGVQREVTAHSASDAHGGPGSLHHLASGVQREAATRLSSAVRGAPGFEDHQVNEDRHRSPTTHPSCDAQRGPGRLDHCASVVQRGAATHPSSHVWRGSGRLNQCMSGVPRGTATHLSSDAPGGPGRLDHCGLGRQGGVAAHGVDVTGGPGCRDHHNNDGWQRRPTTHPTSDSRRGMPGCLDQCMDDCTSLIHVVHMPNPATQCYGSHHRPPSTYARPPNLTWLMHFVPGLLIVVLLDAIIPVLAVLLLPCTLTGIMLATNAEAPLVSWISAYGRWRVGVSALLQAPPMLLTLLAQAVLYLHTTSSIQIHLSTATVRDYFRDVYLVMRGLHQRWPPTTPETQDNGAGYLLLHVFIVSGVVVAAVLSAWKGVSLVVRGGERWLRSSGAGRAVGAVLEFGWIVLDVGLDVLVVAGVYKVCQNPGMNLTEYILLIALASFLVAQYYASVVIQLKTRARVHKVSFLQLLLCLPFAPIILPFFDALSTLVLATAAIQSTVPSSSRVYTSCSALHQVSRLVLCMFTTFLPLYKCTGLCGLTHARHGLALSKRVHVTNHHTTLGRTRTGRYCCMHADDDAPIPTTIFPLDLPLEGDAEVSTPAPMEQQQGGRHTMKNDPYTVRGADDCASVLDRQATYELHGELWRDSKTNARNSVEDAFHNGVYLHSPINPCFIPRAPVRTCTSEHAEHDQHAEHDVQLTQQSMNTAHDDWLLHVRAYLEMRFFLAAALQSLPQAGLQTACLVLLMWRCTSRHAAVQLHFSCEGCSTANRPSPPQPEACHVSDRLITLMIVSVTISIISVLKTGWKLKEAAFLLGVNCWQYAGDILRLTTAGKTGVPTSALMPYWMDSSLPCNDTGYSDLPSYLAGPTSSCHTRGIEKGRNGTTQDVSMHSASQTLTSTATSAQMSWVTHHEFRDSMLGRSSTWHRTMVVDNELADTGAGVLRMLNIDLCSFSMMPSAAVYEQAVALRRVLLSLRKEDVEREWDLCISNLWERDSGVQAVSSSLRVDSDLVRLTGAEGGGGSTIERSARRGVHKPSLLLGRVLQSTSRYLGALRGVHFRNCSLGDRFVQDFMTAAPRLQRQGVPLRHVTFDAPSVGQQQLHSYSQGATAALQCPLSLTITTDTSFEVPIPPPNLANPRLSLSQLPPAHSGGGTITRVIVHWTQWLTQPGVWKGFVCYLRDLPNLEVVNIPLREQGKENAAVMETVSEFRKEKWTWNVYFSSNDEASQQHQIRMEWDRLAAEPGRAARPAQHDRAVTAKHGPMGRTDNSHIKSWLQDL